MAYFLSQDHTEDKNTYTFTGVCIISGDKVSVTVKGPDLFRYHQGELIQVVFPYLTPMEREWTISGIYRGWNELFEEEE